MNRRNFIKTIGFGAAAFAVTGYSRISEVTAKKPSPPNIVVIISDDQGYADVSYNKHHSKHVATPKTDALAKSGVTCTFGYTTGAVCSPTRAGLMTGRYQQRFGIYTAGAGGSGNDETRHKSLKAFLRAKEKEYLDQVLSHSDGDKEKAAKALKISLATLYRKLPEEEE